MAEAVAASRRPAVVVANCCEGDPTSAKDEVLLDRSPHLVIDGALTAAAAVGADRVVLAGHAGSSVLRTLPVALSQRPASAVTVEPVAVPARYLASEATALVRFLNTGDARPAGRLSPIWRKGVDGRPTLVANAETLAQLALLARFGPDWFAALGSPTEPGTVLITVGGAVPAPGVVEVPTGTALRDVLACAGAPPTGWALVGGLAGGWVDLARSAGSRIRHGIPPGRRCEPGRRVDHRAAARRLPARRDRPDRGAPGAGRCAAVRAVHVRIAGDRGGPVRAGRR